MKLAQKIAHLIFPQESNNQKAKLLHPSSITLLAGFLLMFQLVLTFLPKAGSRILGFAANISPNEVIRLTNEKRQAAGLLPLEANSTLAAAAQAKGADMLNRGYWAHTASDGTSPWKFFTDFGYKYRYAGENLARDFSNPSAAMDAWMASSTHKENLLSTKYKEIGVAVVEGDLTGVGTTIIVQFFGTKYADTVPVVPVAKAREVATAKNTAVPEATPLSVATEAKISNIRPGLLISPFKTTRTFSLGVVGLLLGVLVVDGIFVSRRRIVRIGGRTYAHIAFLGMIAAIVLILRAGQII